MAVKMTLIDDLDQSENAKTIEFALDGERYEIDLVDTNAVKLRKALEPFMKAARKTKASTTVKAKSSTSGMRAKKTTRPSRLPGAAEQKQVIRDWAKKRGMKVSNRGRVPKDIVDKFEKEHPLEPAFSG